MKKYSITVYNRAGDEVFGKYANWFKVAKFWNWVLQRVMRFPKFTTVLFEIAENRVIHCKSDLN
jgi:hypothetical protein